MIELLWLNAFGLAVGAAVTGLDLDFRIAGWRAGRPVYGALVLLGLLGVYSRVVATGSIPPPGWPILVFAAAYLPFLSGRFIDLEVTDRAAREGLETLLLERDWASLRWSSDRQVIRRDGRSLRLHWECTVDEDELVVELDVHPSLFPVTVSRPHVVRVRSPLHLERIREEIRGRRRLHDSEPQAAPDERPGDGEPA